MNNPYLRNLFLMFLIYTSISYSQWIDKSPSGFVQGTFVKIYQVSSGTTLWAVGNNGIAMKSTDSGGTWKNIQTGVINNLHSIVFTDSLHGWISGGRILWSTTDSAIVLATTDGGITWKTQYTSYDSYNDVCFIDNNIGWVVGAVDEGSNTGVILRTTDGGIHWNRSTINGAIHVIKFINPKIGFIGRAGYGDGYGGVIQKTTDGGNSWINYGFEYVDDWTSSILDIAWEDSMHCMCINFGQIYYSSDGGISWNPLLGARGTLRDLNHVVSTGESTWFVASSNYFGYAISEILKTTNNGNTWDTSFVEVNDNIIDLKFINSQEGIALTSTGTVIATPNGGSTWALKNPVTQNINSIELFSSSHIIVGGGNGVIMESTSGGDNWQLLNIGTQANINQIKFIDEQIGWVSTSDGFYKTTDGGTHWNKLTSQVFNTFFVYDKLHIYAGSPKTYYGVHGYSWQTALLERSSDGGQTWETYEYRGGDNQTPNSFFFWDAEKGVASLGRGSTALILSTSDGGVTWNQLSPLFNGFMFTITFVNDTLGWGLNLIDVNSNNYSRTVIAKTTDGGFSWNNNRQSESKISSIFFEDIYHGWACGDSGVVLRTSDGGNNWDSVKTAPEKDLYMIKFADNTNGYAVGVGGTILKTINGGVLSVRNQIRDIPNKTILYQNYPNPFNPATNISFSVPSRSFVSLKIYDILGRIVATMISEEMNAGYYSREWNAKEFSSGIYFYRLEAGSFVQTKKLVLIK